MEGVGGVLGFYAIEGVRFYPSEEELFLLLEEKRIDPAFTLHTVLDYNIYEYEPSELFGLPGIRHGEKWCYFYCAPNYVKAEESSQRLQQLIETGYCDDSVKRSTKTGYWKVTGKPRFIKAKGSKKEIGLKRNLVFYKRPPGSQEIKTNWEDFILCRIRWKRDKKPRTSTRIDDRRARKARSSAKIHDRRAEKARISAKNETQDLKSCDLFNDAAQPIHNVVFNDAIRNHVVEKGSPESNWDAISIRNHVAENISPESQAGTELLPVPGCDLTFNSGHHIADAPEYFLQVDPLLHAKQNPLSGCTVLDQTSFFALQSLIYPELQPLPSYSISNFRQHAAETSEYTSQEDPRLVMQSVINGCSGLEQTSCLTMESPIYPELQPLPSCDSISNSGHHVAGAPEYTSPVDPLLTDKQSLLSGCSGLDQTSCLAMQSGIYPESQLLPSCDWTSNSAHHVAEFPKYTSEQNTLPVIPSMLNGCSGLDQTSCFTLHSPIYPESQPLPSCGLTSNSAHHIAEAPKYTSQEDPGLVIPSVLNGCSGLEQTSCFTLLSLIYPESQPLPSCDSISYSGQHAAETPEYTSKVDPPLSRSNPSAFDSCRELDQTSFSTHPEEEFSYPSNVTYSDYDVLNCPLGFEWEDYNYFTFNPPSAVPV